MGRIRSRRPRKPRARHFTPPIELSFSEGQIKTPQRCAVLAAKAFAQELCIPISQELVRKVTGVPPRNQTRILASKQVRTRHNQPDSGPDPRGKKRGLTRTDTVAIAEYLDDSAVSLYDKGKPWQDIAEEAGIKLPQTLHFKPLGLRTINPKPIQRACRDDEDIINAVCEEERKLTSAQATARTDWVNEQLSL
jgi:hypothetical protein